MADVLALDLGAYTGTYKLIGGAVALDFANLVSYRNSDRVHDWLFPAKNAEIWAKAAGIVASVVEPIEEIRDFRELIARVFLAVADGETPEADDVSKISDYATELWKQRVLRFDARRGGARWIDLHPTLLQAIALNASDLLTSAESLARVGACEECRWVFLDTSRNHQRRWCDPADCGNRARQRRYYRRRSRAASANE